MAVNENDYNTWFEGQNPAGDAYTFCCWQILAGIRTWIIRNQFQGEIAYFFEAGHASQSRANALMTRIFNDPRLASGVLLCGACLRGQAKGQAGSNGRYSGLAASDPSKALAEERSPYEERLSGTNG